MIAALALPCIMAVQALSNVQWDKAMPEKTAEPPPKSDSPVKGMLQNLVIVAAAVVIIGLLAGMFNRRMTQLAMHIIIGYVVFTYVLPQIFKPSSEGPALGNQTTAITVMDESLGTIASMLPIMALAVVGGTVMILTLAFMGRNY